MIQKFNPKKASSFPDTLRHQHVFLTWRGITTGMIVQQNNINRLFLKRL